MVKVSAVFNKIHLLRERYYNASTGKEALIALIGEAEISEQVYNSNAIENSTLTLEETEKILLQIDLDRFISEREIFEAKNLARVVSYISTKAKEQELNLDGILALHKMLISNIRDDIAGRFRVSGEYVRVGSHIAPAPEEVAGRLGKMLAEYHASHHESVIKRVAKLHLAFEYTHPFIDGNGRIGRLLALAILLKNNYAPDIIRQENKRRYYLYLNQAQLKNSFSHLENFFCEAVAEGFEIVES